MKNDWGLYTLVGQTPVPCDDLLEWAMWRANADKRVALTHVGPIEISTVFLGVDHNWRDHGPPILFETMIFIAGQRAIDGMPPDMSIQQRYSTWREAERGHKRAVAQVVAIRLPHDEIEELYPEPLPEVE